jgi:hypothetical protein
LVPHYIDAEQALGCVGPIVIRVVDSARTTNVDVDRFVAMVADILERAPAAGMWVIVHHDAPIPDHSIRRYMSQQMKPYNDRVTAVFTLLGLGFWAAAASAATLGITKLVGISPVITTTIEAGAERMCMDLIGVDPARLVAAHSTLLQRISQ